MRTVNRGALDHDTLGVASMVNSDDAPRELIYAPRAIRVADGVEIAYVDRGSGQPVVLIPGWTMSCEVFVHQLDDLAQDFRVIAVDPRGHGRSSSTIHGNSYPQQGRDLAAIMGVLDLADVHLIGWSCGSLAMYAYLDQFGIDRVRSVTSIDMTPKPLGKIGDGEWAIGDVHDSIEISVKALVDPDGFALSFAEDMLERPLSAFERDWLVAMHLGVERHVVIALEVSAMHCDYRELAARISSLVPYANAVRENRIEAARRWLSGHAPDSVVWPISSHLGFWEKPAEFNHRLLEFLHEGR